MDDTTPLLVAPGAARRLAIGAELLGASRTSFRVWAPDHDTVRLVVDGATHAMIPDGDGYFRADASAGAGSRYGFRLGDHDDRLYPDPASRFQPDGPHELSAVVDPHAYAWRDLTWKGVRLPGQVLYELHIGTFTRAGTWRAAAAHLSQLRDLGVTLLEVMPVADFPGAFGWGYDGVSWFAPTRLYGDPDDCRRFVDEAHALGLGVLLDVVYNHLGPSGNYLARFARDYFSDRHATDWGAGINFDGPRAAHVRELVLANVEHWVREFHVDGFRLDATHAIQDESDEHLLAALSARARAAAEGRAVLIVAENDLQHTRLLRPGRDGGHGLDALFSEDFHHVARVALTGQRDAYYSDYSGSAEELLAAARWGFLFQGQQYGRGGEPRGMPALDIAAPRFVCFLENHDQVANSSTGRRLTELAGPGQLRALTTLLLLGPCTPMLFQGQEYGSTRPFHFFADHEPELAERIRVGRERFLSQFTRCADPGICVALPNPSARETFESSKLDREASPRTTAWWHLHQDLLRLRREDAVLSNPDARWEGATLDDRRLLLRVSVTRGRDSIPSPMPSIPSPITGERLLVVNLGHDVDLARVTHPFVAPPTGDGWRLLWSSESATYGGAGTPPLDAHRWTAPGHAAIVLASDAVAHERIGA
jgi:maltooligosyltrehalose trehalohydrolase